MSEHRAMVPKGIQVQRVFLADGHRIGLADLPQGRESLGGLDPLAGGPNCGEPAPLQGWPGTPIATWRCASP